MKSKADMTYTITGRKTARLDQGIGFNLVYRQPFMPQAHDECRWEKWLNDLDDLQPAWFRFWLTPNEFFDAAGKFNWNCDVFDAFRRLDRWCGNNNAKIMLGLSYIPLCPERGVHAKDTAKRKPVEGASQNALSVLTSDDCRRRLRDFAERFLVPLVRHLLDEMKLENIDFLSLVNEPDFGVRSDGGDRVALYYEAVKAARTALDKAGYTPNRMPLLGPGCMGLDLGWPDDFILRDLPLAEHVGAIDAHHYHAHFDWAPRDPDRWAFPMSQAIDILRRGMRYAAKYGKRFYITEMGTFYLGKGWGKGPRGTNPDGPGYHEATILDAEFIVRSMPLGVGGFLRWCLNPTRDPGFWVAMDEGDAHIRHPNTYPLYRQLMRSTPRGSEILAAENPWWHSIAYPPLFLTPLLLPDGNLSIHLVNNANMDCYVAEIAAPVKWHGRQWRCFRTDRLHKCESMPIDMNKGVIRDSATPMSLTTYTTKEI